MDDGTTPEDGRGMSGASSLSGVRPIVPSKSTKPHLRPRSSMKAQAVGEDLSWNKDAPPTTAEEIKQYKALMIRRFEAEKKMLEERKREKLRMREIADAQTVPCGSKKVLSREELSISALRMSLDDLHRQLLVNTALLGGGVRINSDPQLCCALDRAAFECMLSLGITLYAPRMGRPGSHECVVARSVGDLAVGQRYISSWGTMIYRQHGIITFSTNVHKRHDDDDDDGDGDDVELDLELSLLEENAGALPHGLLVFDPDGPALLDNSSESAEKVLETLTGCTWAGGILFWTRDSRVPFLAYSLRSLCSDVLHVALSVEGWRLVHVIRRGVQGQCEFGEDAPSSSLASPLVVEEYSINGEAFLGAEPIRRPLFHASLCVYAPDMIVEVWPSAGSNGAGQSMVDGDEDWLSPECTERIIAMLTLYAQERMRQRKELVASLLGLSLPEDDEEHSQEETRDEMAHHHHAIPPRQQEGGSTTAASDGVRPPKEASDAMTHDRGTLPTRSLSRSSERVRGKDDGAKRPMSPATAVDPRRYDGARESPPPPPSRIMLRQRRVRAVQRTSSDAHASCALISSRILNEEELLILSGMLHADGASSSSGKASVDGDALHEDGTTFGATNMTQAVDGFVLQELGKRIGVQKDGILGMMGDGHRPHDVDGDDDVDDVGGDDGMGPVDDIFGSGLDSVDLRSTQRPLCPAGRFCSVEDPIHFVEYNHTARTLDDLLDQVAHRLSKPSSSSSSAPQTRSSVTSARSRGGVRDGAVAEDRLRSLLHASKSNAPLVVPIPMRRDRPSFPERSTYRRDKMAAIATKAKKKPPVKVEFCPSGPYCDDTDLEHYAKYFHGRTTAPVDKEPQRRLSHPPVMSPQVTQSVKHTAVQEDGEDGEMHVNDDDDGGDGNAISRAHVFASESKSVENVHPAWLSSPPRPPTRLYDLKESRYTVGARSLGKFFSELLLEQESARALEPQDTSRPSSSATTIATASGRQEGTGMRNDASPLAMADAARHTTSCIKPGVAEGPSTSSSSTLSKSAIGGSRRSLVPPMVPRRWDKPATTNQSETPPSLWVRVSKPVGSATIGRAGMAGLRREVDSFYGENMGSVYQPAQSNAPSGNQTVIWKRSIAPRVRPAQDVFFTPSQSSSDHRGAT